MKRILSGFLTTITLIFLAGCSSLPFLNSSQNNRQGGQNGFNTDPATLPVQMKLGIGTLKLDGTDLAVTPEQAKTLLPLWKALKNLAADTNTTADEIKALNQQIEDSMTKEQVAAIQKMTWTQQEIRSLMQQDGIGGGGSNGNGTQTTPGASSTQRRSGNTGGFPGGPDGGPPPGNFFGPGGAGANGNRSSAGTARTPVPGQAARRAADGMNLLFADPVIKLLEGKISG